MPEIISSPYDDVADMYHTLWADWYLPATRPALERLFFSQVAPGARVLDLCCGSGHVTKELAARGYRVTGVDNSANLIALAKQELPGIDFRVQDARNLKLNDSYNAALSTFDSLNHILSVSELEDVFAGVRRVLERRGLFVFDMNLAEAYSVDLREWSVNISDTSVGLVRGNFDAARKKATTELIWFVRETNEKCWSRHESSVEQQCYDQTEILTALSQSGFQAIEAISARDAGVSSELGFGRTYFAARVQE